MNDDFNYLGALTILELTGRSDLSKQVTNSDWTCLPEVYQTLTKAVVDNEIEENGSDIVDAYFDIIRKSMGVKCDEISEIPRVLENLKKYAQEEDKETLGRLSKIIQKEDYFEFIITAGIIVNKMNVLSSLVHDCCNLIINSLEVDSDCENEEN